MEKLKNYPDKIKEDHKNAHLAFLKKIFDFERALHEKNLAVILELATGGIIDFMKTWIKDHIIAFDV